MPKRIYPIQGTNTSNVKQGKHHRTTQLQLTINAFIAHISHTIYRSEILLKEHTLNLIRVRPQYHSPAESMSASKGLVEQ